MLFITGCTEGEAVGHGLRNEKTEIMAKPSVVEALAARMRGIIDG